MYWLHRLGFLTAMPDLSTPDDLSLDDAGVRVAAMEQAWDAYLANLDDTEASKRFEYKSWEGPTVENSVADILMHLHGHSVSHKGQIATRLRQIGAEPAEVEYVFWCRVPVEG